MSQPIALRGRWLFQHVDELAHSLRPIHVRGAPVLDLSSVEHMDAATVATLVAILRARAISDPGSGLEIQLPHTSDLRRWLMPETRAPLLSPATGREPAVSKASVGFDGCEPFSSGEGITRAIFALRASLLSRASVPDETLASIVAMLGDLTENVLQHAGVRDGVATAILAPDEDVLDVAVVDRGRGIPTSLRNNPIYRDLADDRRALERALEAAVSGDTGARGGLGLWMLKHVVADNGGALSVRSGRGALIQQATVRSRGGLTDHTGTVVSVRVRLRAPFDYRALDDRLSQPAGVRG